MLPMTSASRITPFVISHGNAQFFDIIIVNLNRKVDVYEVQLSALSGWNS